MKEEKILQHSSPVLPYSAAPDIVQRELGPFPTATHQQKQQNYTTTKTQEIPA
jgi:hypothetical protein